MEDIFVNALAKNTILCHTEFVRQNESELKMENFFEMNLTELKDQLFKAVVKNDKTMEYMVKQAINERLNTPLQYAL